MKHVVKSLHVVEANQMSFLKTALAVLLGFVLGAALYHPKPTKAASNVYVQQGLVGTYNPIRGTTVVGFSCTDTSTSAVCYVASQ